MDKNKTELTMIVEKKKSKLVCNTSVKMLVLGITRNYNRW